MGNIDPAASAWLVVCSALVLLMAPALALFYGGTRAGGANAASILAPLGHRHSDPRGPVDPLRVFARVRAHATRPHRWPGLRGTGGVLGAGRAASLFAACRMMFAVIAPALVSGALGARMKLSAYVAFVLFWSTLVYDPVAHWLWATGAGSRASVRSTSRGGIVVHFIAGVSAVVCAVVIGRAGAERTPSGRTLARDVAHRAGRAAVLWFGWFALNAGAGPRERRRASGLSVRSTTQLGAAGGGLGWLVVEWSHRGRPTAMGVASGVVLRASSRPRRPRASSRLRPPWRSGSSPAPSGTGRARRRLGARRRAARDHRRRGPRRAGDGDCHRVHRGRRSATAPCSSSGASGSRGRPIRSACRASAASPARS